MTHPSTDTAATPRDEAFWIEVAEGIEATCREEVAYWTEIAEAIEATEAGDEA